MESHIEQEESDSSRQSADLRIRKTQVDTTRQIRSFRCCCCCCWIFFSCSPWCRGCFATFFLFEFVVSINRLFEGQGLKQKNVCTHFFFFFWSITAHPYLLSHQTIIDRQTWKYTCRMSRLPRKLTQPIIELENYRYIWIEHSTNQLTNASSLSFFLLLLLLLASLGLSTWSLTLTSPTQTPNSTRHSRRNLSK